MNWHDLGIRTIRILGRETSQDAFAEWPNAELAVISISADSAELQPKVLAETCQAVRMELEFPILPDSVVHLHHPAFVRMRNLGWIDAKQDWRAGRRSALASNIHFDMRLGEPPFGMPPFLRLEGLERPVLLGALTESHARLTFDWKVEPHSIVVGLQWSRQGRSTYPVTSDWPAESFCILRAPESIPRYFDELLNRLPPMRSTEPNLLWGSWNDGLYRDVDEERILATATWLRQNSPEVCWIQIDDGWADTGDPDAPMSHFGVFYEGASRKVDPRFPGGMKGLAVRIRELGLRPMIWLTPAVHERSALFCDHPNWFQPETRLYFMPELRFLDTSVPEARDYVESVFQTVFEEWGFEGAKLDFWTMGFDQPDVGYRGQEADEASQCRWFVETLRRHLPADGRLLHCIDLPFGSPFRSPGFDAFRYYADSEGSCQDLEKMKEQAIWAAFLVGVYGVQRFWIPDGDGMGLFRHFSMPDNHYQLWLSFLVGSGTLLELAGWLHRSLDDPRLHLLQRTLPFVRTGLAVDLPDFESRGSELEPPFCWRRADGLIGLTNWGSQPRQWRVDARRLDVLSGETFESGATVDVAPESGRILAPIQGLP